MILRRLEAARLNTAPALLPLAEDGPINIPEPRTAHEIDMLYERIPESHHYLAAEIVDGKIPSVYGVHADQHVDAGDLTPENPLPRQNPIRCRGVPGISMSSRIALKMILNFSSWTPCLRSSSSSRRERTAWEAAARRRETKARIMAMFT